MYTARFELARAAFGIKLIYITLESISGQSQGGLLEAEPAPQAVSWRAAGMVLGGPAVHLLCVSAVLGPTQKPPPLTVTPTALQLVPVQVRKIRNLLKSNTAHMAVFLSPFSLLRYTQQDLCARRVQLCDLHPSLEVEGKKVVLSLPPSFAKD